jgi:hypothetical protein
VTSDASSARSLDISLESALITRTYSLLPPPLVTETENETVNETVNAIAIVIATMPAIDMTETETVTVTASVTETAETDLPIEAVVVVLFLLLATRWFRRLTLCGRHHLPQPPAMECPCPHLRSTHLEMLAMTLELPMDYLLHLLPCMRRLLCHIVGAMTAVAGRDRRLEADRDRLLVAAGATLRDAIALRLGTAEIRAIIDTKKRKPGSTYFSRQSQTRKEGEHTDYTNPHIFTCTHHLRAYTI